MEIIFIAYKLETKTNYPEVQIVKEFGNTDEIVYMTADIEDEFTIAQANEPLDDEGHFLDKRVSARFRDEIIEVPGSRIDYMDVSPRQLVSVVTACIPFLENDDANRALMGSNMQCQAVPLLTTDSPIVGTGMEHKVAKDSGSAVLAREDGVVLKVSSDEIIIKGSQTGTNHKHKLIKFARSNQSTCINQHPIVEVGETVKKGDIIGILSHNIPEFPITLFAIWYLGGTVLLLDTNLTPFEYDNMATITDCKMVCAEKSFVYKTDKFKFYDITKS